MCDGYLMEHPKTPIDSNDRVRLETLQQRTENQPEETTSAAVGPGVLEVGAKAHQPIR